MAVSESRKKANLKWDAANLDRLSIATAKGKKEEIKAAAAAAGESMNQYIVNAIDQRMSGNSSKAAQEPAGAHGGSGNVLTPEAVKTAQEAAQKAGETIPAFVERAVVTQAQRDKVAQGLLRAKEKAPDHSGT